MHYIITHRKCEHGGPTLLSVLVHKIEGQNTRRCIHTYTHTLVNVDAFNITSFNAVNRLYLH